jgi:hypothetical protein
MQGYLHEQIARERHREACRQARQARLVRALRAERRARRAAEVADRAKDRVGAEIAVTMN